MTQDAKSPSVSPIEVSFPLRRALYTTLHIHLTFLATTTMVFLTTTSTGESKGVTRPMGSFVYAMPNRLHHGDTLATSMYTTPNTIDYARRTAQALARRMNMPVYVGCSIELSGQVAEEETAGLAQIINTILAKWEEVKGKKEAQS
ncbi:hypothetical protein D8B26_002802 [Coccidioides posadasii str. Silveira]|uniref:Uncharacterized protein n=1 Tax=Coccidioides posadasii (strain RMSCC 757 / Silveira) TaxID=443226 RepID=E9CY83_COCPS|nr:conserved hypothetical protein [Coccidioides posadasii str. Silveira]QVM08104.1 hypothetical protein D8B26_002802 [Coccidioides posadasii str. Silveira]